MQAGEGADMEASDGQEGSMEDRGMARQEVLTEAANQGRASLVSWHMKWHDWQVDGVHRSRESQRCRQVAELGSMPG